ncbi:MAG: DUF4337 family protein [Verrucomicrobia bacterium]|nr:DUF4337 family protein [Verrucomicrobiota bacterium]
MKITIPEELKSDMPPTRWGKILSATPVILTVLATMLAGLSSSEMTRAQYNRSLAAQQQSKAGDQWGFFQAKRLRGSMQRGSLDLLQSFNPAAPLTAEALHQELQRESSSGSGTGAAEALTLLSSPAGKGILSSLIDAQLPGISPRPAVDKNIQTALDAVEKFEPEVQVSILMGSVTPAMLDQELAVARAQSRELDEATRPINQALEKIENLLASQVTGSPGDAVRRAFTVARLRYTGARYELEARLNQAVAAVYELQVRKSNLIAERHHRRSQKFFFGMLGGQAGVIISTFAMAARKRNLLWTVAAVVGILALVLAIYVYLYV